MERLKKRRTGIKYMLAGGTVVAALGMFMEPQSLFANMMSAKTSCQEVIQPKSVLSREQLSQLLAIPDRTPKEQLRQVTKAPYCRLVTVATQSGTVPEREAYPLAFDPQTWLIITYEGGEYTGYTFSFKR
ncbi:hypothetical protein OsccyDRAFT_2504 [Leptolyngbyaceae cyanobacterium JSC-12]|nr:hypothetical protein OsccyDRAFT_2504 [Leptolyngbyaceae cyanobacterium JSC-12]